TFLSALGFAALLTAMPDLIYHQQVFGGVLNVESEELQYFGANAIGAASARMLGEFMLPHEFGFMFPLTMLGAVQMVRAQSRLFVVLCAWPLSVTAIHLPYAALRLRDLLGEFPVLMWWTAWGAASLFTMQTRRRWLKVAAIAFVLLVLSLRTQTTLARALTPHTAGFGYMLPAERKAFDQIARLTPENAVIAATLSSGALDLYAHRLTVRPTVWSVEQFDRFASAMNADGRPLFLLYDSPDLRLLREHLLASGKLDVVQQFSSLTFFGDREAEAGTLYRVMQY
ncbi:MAG: hypothetical protein LC737_11515, partial [Chloroflexi bacterium]|nr:hypothetical protein [Chloroflexota bacterium]